MTGAQFTVIDQVDPSEISEDTVLYVDGRLVARFKLDRAHPEGRATVSVPAAPAHTYALCGRITLQREDGAAEQRVVAGGGPLPDPGGQVFQALAGGDFRIFYLAPAGAPGPPPPEARAIQACDLPSA